MADILVLDAASLFSKWGFCDGDPCESLENRFDADWSERDDYSHLLAVWHDVLTELVEQRLVPAIRERGHSLETYRISGCHNPIRAESMDGVEYDGYTPAPFQWGEITVSLPLDEVEQLVRNAKKRPDPQ